MTTQKTNAFSLLSDSNSTSKNPFLAAFEPKNPFAPASEEVEGGAPEGSYTYRLVQSGPEVPAEECETQALAVEVMIRWGATVLHVAELSPVRSFVVGEDDKTDFFLPEEKLGARRMPLVLAGEGGASLVIPEGATGTFTPAGGQAKGVEALIASGEAVACEAAPGAHRIALPEGARAAIDVNGLSFEVSAGNAGRRAGRFSLRGDSLPYQGLSLLLHASLLAATALFVPSLAMANEDGVTDDQKYEMMAMLNAEAIHEPDQVEAPSAESPKPGQHGDVGQAAKGEMGKAGSTMSRDQNKRFSVEGKGGETYLSRAEAIRAAQDFGMVGLLASLEGSVNAPTSPFGREIANGSDPMNAKGNMFGETIGDAIGAGGLNLTGVGESGGGPGQYIGVGRVGTVGHDFVDGGGHSTWIPHGTHQTRSPVLARIGVPTVGGRLPPEVIQRVVRQNFGRFKACYENGLRGNPNLQGRVAVRFVINHDGSVSSVANGGSDLPDVGVVSCVTRAFYGLSFPQPENGIVTVTYPIVFSPAN